MHVAKILKLHNGDTLRVGVVRHRQQRTNHHNHHNIHHSTNSKVTNIANRYNDNDDSNNLAGLLTDNATITWIPEGKNKLAQPTKNGDSPGSLCITIPHPIMTQSSTSTTAASSSSSSSMIIKNQIISTRLDDNDNENTSATMFNDNDNTTTNDDHNDDVDVPRVSLLLAIPRPLQLQRLLPMVAQIGVEHIVLTNANKVPKDYFGCRILRINNNNNNNNDNNSDDDNNNKDDNNDNIALQNLLIEGLSICGNDVTLPTVTITKRLRILLANGGELDRLFPRELYARVIAHPTRLLPLVDDDGTSSRSNIDDDDDDDDGNVERIPIVTTRRMADVVFPINTQQEQRQPKRMLVAVGPEGGWEEPYELIMFANAGFQQVSLGARVLRSDVAVVSLLALANEVCYS
jgi:16S rRNA U1498 N3-methylase RsmE